MGEPTLQASRGKIVLKNEKKAEKRKKRNHGKNEPRPADYIPKVFSLALLKDAACCMPCRSTHMHVVSARAIGNDFKTNFGKELSCSSQGSDCSHEDVYHIIK